MKGVRSRVLSLPGPPVLGACGRGPLPSSCGCGVRVWGPALPTVRASLRALRSVGGSGVLGTCSRAVVRCVLCALPEFAAPSGRDRLAPVRVPWLWPAACISGVPRAPALVRRASSGPVALSAPVGFPATMGPSPTRGFRQPDLLGGCAGHVEAGREPGSWCLPLAPAEAGALGSLRIIPIRAPAMGLSLAGPSGVGLGLRALRWFGVCGLSYSRVRFPAPSAFQRGPRPVHRGSFVWTPTPPLSGGRMPHPGPVRVRLCALFLAGSGRPASRARFGAQNGFIG